MDCHIDPENLERYAMRRVSDEEAARYEEHLLFCDPCRALLEDTESQLTAMKSAAAQIRVTEATPTQSWWRWRLPRLVPAAAALAFALAAILILRFPATSGPPVAITLVATRGAGIEASVPAGRKLSLTPDLTALPPANAYRMEIVDERGRITWQGEYAPAQGAASASAQDSGTHFVRIYASSGELLREYGLEVKR